MDAVEKVVETIEASGACNGRVIEMKMAKADSQDFASIKNLLELCEEYFEYGTFTPFNEETEEESQDLTAEQFIELLRERWQGKVDMSWRRVVYGAELLIENVCDPESTTLEWKPELAKKLED